jgi:single-strand selective monofunctional uracil DNA glycosylase
MSISLSWRNVARDFSVAPMKGPDPLGRCWKRAARRFEPMARQLARATGWLVLNPGRYGERWHARFRRAYPMSPRPLLVFGLNPGPYGMAQTGVPFTDLKRLESALPGLWKDLVASGEPVTRPGLAPPSLARHLTRTFESSSVRVYRFLERAYGRPELALREVVFVNPCPLLFIDPETGANRTPADLPRALRARKAAELVHAFEELRRATVLEAVAELEPRGAILLGRDVAAAVGEALRAALGARSVVEWEHPARAVPETWSRGLADELRKRGLLRPLAKSRSAR